MCRKKSTTESLLRPHRQPSFLPMCNGLARQTWCWVNLGVNWVGDNDKAKRMSTKKNLTYSSCKLAEYISRIDLLVKKGYGSIFLGPPVTFLGCNYILQPNLRLTKNHGNFLQPPEKVVVSISASAILQSRIWIEHWTNCRILIDYLPMIVGIAGYVLYFHVKYPFKNQGNVRGTWILYIDIIQCPTT